jgi:hypothetical protein
MRGSLPALLLKGGRKVVVGGGGAANPATSELCGALTHTRLVTAPDAPKYQLSSLDVTAESLSLSLISVDALRARRVCAKWGPLGCELPRLRSFLSLSLSLSLSLYFFLFFILHEWHLTGGLT